MNDRRLLHRVKLADGAPGWRGVAFTPDGRRLVVASGPSVEVWAADPPARESVVGAFAAERVTVCDTGRLVVATDGASTARVWTTQGRLVATYAPDYPPVFAAHAHGPPSGSPAGDSTGPSGPPPSSWTWPAPASWTPRRGPRAPFDRAAPGRPVIAVRRRGSGT